MKTFKFMIGGFCAIGMMACSSNEDVVNNGGTPDGQETNSYLTINVVPASNITRAVTEDSFSDGKYEDGTENENTVSNAYFYFFDENGNAANVVKNLSTGGMVNYYMASSDEDTDYENSETPNVEKVLQATVVINTKNGDEFPAKIVAVLNGTTPTQSTANLETLSKTVGDYRLTATATDGKFVMSSTVYADNSVKKMEVDVPQVAYYDSEEAAQEHPVDIYVERVLAKVSVGTSMEGSITLDDGTKIYDTGQTTNKASDGTKIYVKFLGWNVAQEPQNSYLFKNINPQWTDDNLGITSWTWPAYKRSFWAMNPENMELGKNSFEANKKCFVGQVDAQGYVAYAKEGEGTAVRYNYTYIQENASPYSSDGTASKSIPTQIIFPAQLVDNAGTKIALAEWKGIRSTPDGDGILKSIANFSTGIYYKRGDNTSSKLTPDLIEIKSGKDDTGVASYNSYVQLTSAASTITFYKDSQCTEAYSGADDVNTLLKGLGAVKVWTDGLCYYYTDIKHLGNAESVSEYGIVRNHSYQVVVNSVTGLGTPVFDPEEDIIPDKPEDNESYLAARIKVLSWRVVKSTVDLK